MRSERVVVRVVVLEGKASVVPHAQNISFIEVWSTPLCLGTRTRIGVLIAVRWVNCFICTADAFPSSTTTRTTTRSERISRMGVGWVIVRVVVA